MPGEHYLDDAGIAELKRMKRWMTNLRITGAGVTFVNGPEGASASIAAPKQTTVQPAQRHVSVKVSSIVSGQVGRYNGKQILDGLNGAATGALAEANFNTISSSEDCVIWHAPEIAIASTKHLLKTGAIYTGARFAGVTSTNKSILLLGVLPVGETASPTTFSPSGATANATTWSRAADGTPVTIAHATRVYLDTSAHKLYLFVRTFTYDACGILTSISAETRSDIDTTSACP